MGVNKTFGYMRVSTKNQSTDRQEEKILPLVESERDIYTDYESGKDFARAQYQALKDKLRRGDTVVVLSLDRLGRNYGQMKAEWQWFKEQGVTLTVLDFPLLSGNRNSELGLTSELLADIVFMLFSYVADLERQKILERTRAGQELARKRGDHIGRPKVELPPDFLILAQSWKNGQMQLKDAVAKSGLKRSTFVAKANAMLQK